MINRLHLQEFYYFPQDGNVFCDSHLFLWPSHPAATALVSRHAHIPPSQGEEEDAPPRHLLSLNRLLSRRDTRPLSRAFTSPYLDIFSHPFHPRSPFLLTGKAGVSTVMACAPTLGRGAAGLSLCYRLPRSVAGLWAASDS